MKRDFLSLYNHLCGQSEIPKGFHGWAALSLIAALAEKRVWFEKFKGSKMYPNIYVLLIGPSGIGKGGAIGQAMRVLSASELDPEINIYRGSTTHAHLEDLLGKPVRTEEGEYVQPSSHLWLIMDELAHNLGEKNLAERFIKMVTELYTGDYNLSGGTRTHGLRTILKPSVNWFAGTTIDWLFDAIATKEVFSGFTARVFFCFRDYIDIRFPEPMSPPDYDEVMGHLVNKIRAISLAEGEFQLTPEARRIKNKWYETRPLPRDMDTIAAWKRGDDLIIKLMMIYSLAESTDLIIKPQHFIRAKTTFDHAFKDLDLLMALACSTKETEETKFVESVIEERGKVNRTALGRLTYRKGILATKLDIIIKDIESRGLVRTSTSKMGAKIYEWL